MLGSTLGCGTNPYQNNDCTNIGIQGRPTRVEAIVRLHSNDKVPDLPASVDVNDSGKPCSLLLHGKNCSCKNLYSTDPKVFN
jgi:hypothetical protein